MILDDKRRKKLFDQGGLYHIFQDKGFNGFVKQHSHTFYQFTVLVQGCISWMYDGEAHRQHEAEILFSPPNSRHSLFVFNNDTIYYTLSFSRQMVEAAGGSGLPDELTEMLSRTMLLPIPDEGERRRMLKLLDVLMLDLECTRSDGFTPGCHICTAVLMLFLDIMRQNADLLSQAPPPADDPEHRITVVQHYIDQHFCEDLSVEQLIEMSGCTKTVFFSNFRKVTGVTPKQYITEKRMYQALQLIENTDSPFCQIAEEVGYHDFSTFFRNFYRMSSCSPTEYRQKWLQT